MYIKSGSTPRTPSIPGLPRRGPASKKHCFDMAALAVVPPASSDPMLEVFTKDGTVFSLERVETVAGTRSDCHANVVALWRSGEVVALGTGYGLNGDFWREHSWGWGGEDRLVETTEQRECYFGVRMEGNRAAGFADWIDPPQS